MKPSSFKINCSFAGIFLCLALSVLANLLAAQIKNTKQFTFCKEKGDTIHIDDLVNCKELISTDPKLKIKSYVISLRLHEEFEDFDPNEGSTIIPDIYREILNQEEKLDYIKIKDIIAMDGKVEKKFNGFKLYVK